jgi:hypothetical protein
LITLTEPPHICRGSAASGYQVPLSLRNTFTKAITFFSLWPASTALSNKPATKSGICRVDIGVKGLLPDTPRRRNACCDLQCLVVDYSDQGSDQKMSPGGIAGAQG